MKKRLLATLLIPLLMLGACGREEGPGDQTLRLPQDELYHGMIQLGEKLDDPYTVENMRNAFTKVYPTKAERDARVEEVMDILQVSRSTAYHTMQKLNKELKDKGFITHAGRVSRSYLMQRCGL